LGYARASPPTAIAPSSESTQGELTRGGALVATKAPGNHSASSNIRGYQYFRRWQRDGTWDRLLADAQTKNDAVGQVEWVISVDASVIRTHQHAAGARHCRPR
jgi:transposase